MSEVTIANFASAGERALTLRVAGLLDNVVFGSLMILLALSAVPYGTVEPWWKAAFVSAVFLVSIVAIVETLLSDECRIPGPRGILFSMLTVCALGLVQTISIRSGNPDPAVAALGAWNAISADPYQTRFFVLQLLALTVCLALLYRYCRTPARINLLIHVVMAIGVASALFGILRQTLQHEPGFVLPRTRPGQGYGQFINKNHFALLMEMTLGLGVGIGLLNGANRDRRMLYVALLLPIWTGLVLSNSRGGILAMLAQVVIAALLLTSHFIRSETGRSNSPIIRGALLVLLVITVGAGTVWVGGDRLVSSFSEARREFAEDPSDLRTG